MTFPGADTIKAGIIGEDCLRFICARGLDLVPFVPLICTLFTPSFISSSSKFEGISEVGDKEGVLEVGVVMMWLRELDRDELRLGRAARN